MAYRTLNRVSAVLPPILSAAAVGLILFAMTTGWGQGKGDEGAAAHIFQIMMALQLPVIALFLATADWRVRRPILGAVMVQIAAIGVVFAVGAWFRI